MKKIYKIIAGMILTAACAGIYLWFSAQPLTVRTERLTAGDLQAKFTVQGTVLPVESVILNAGESGVVSDLPFQVGNTIMAGETVVGLIADDDAETELRLAQMRQSLAAARQAYAERFGDGGSRERILTEVYIKRDLAQSEYDAAKWDYETSVAVNTTIPGTITETELNRLQQRLTAAAQSLTLAQNAVEESLDDSSKGYYIGQIASWETQISILEKSAYHTPVTAPYQGVLWALYTEAGAYVTKRQPLAKMYRDDAMRLEASVLTEDAMSMRPGENALCELADGISFTAKLTYISPVASQSISVIGIEEYRHIIELDPGDMPGGTGAGRQVDITFINALAENVLTAPVTAIVALADGGNAVYLVIDGRAVQRPVVAGRRSGGRVELVSGVAVNDEIIVNPYDTGVKEKSRVQGL